MLRPASMPTQREEGATERYSANIILMSSVYFDIIKVEKCANINMPLKER